MIVVIIIELKNTAIIILMYSTSILFSFSYIFPDSFKSKRI